MKNDLILSAIFLVLAVLGIILKKTYYVFPTKELKRRAEEHDPEAVPLYKTVAYGASLKMLLWLYLSLTLAASLTYLAKGLPIGASILISALVLYLLFSLLPALKVSRADFLITKLFTPSLTFLLRYIHPVFSKIGGLVESRYKPLHTGLFERQDLLELIERQAAQTDNRLSPEELAIIARALVFNDKKITSVLTPRKKVKTLLASDTVGPVLIDELHQNPLGYVLVKDSARGKVVGVLAFRDLNLKSQGKVQDHMNDSPNYLNENDSLSEALHAFFTTNQPLFIVLNNFSEYVGIVTIGSIVGELLGHIPGDDFSEYTDEAAVAGRYNKVEDEPETSIKTDEEVIK